MKKAELTLIPSIDALVERNVLFPIDLPKKQKELAENIHPRWSYGASSDRRHYGLFFGIYSKDGYVVSWDSQTRSWSVDE